MELTETARKYLSERRKEDDAERRSCFLPLGGIYWSDEIPNFKDLLEIPEPDRLCIYHLFRIRFKIWDEKNLTDSEMEFWMYGRSILPDCPIFMRTEISEADRMAQAEVERSAIEGFEALFSSADEIEIQEDGGFQSFSAKFDLKVHRRKESHASRILRPFRKLWTKGSNNKRSSRAEGRSSDLNDG